MTELNYAIGLVAGHHLIGFVFIEFTVETLQASPFLKDVSRRQDNAACSKMAAAERTFKSPVNGVAPKLAFHALLRKF
ncbi:hypothetical protein [Rhizobium mongolense]|uniref:hypothetical protein n=1 Tax=Rhizobium mongolense TaxID=57676 RepID=UPI000B80764F|nr:hypothetical protein [Rhizobium mongolense]